MKTTRNTQLLSMSGAALFIILACIQGYRHIGAPPVLIVGGSGIAGFILWYKTYLKEPIDPRLILPVFLLTVAALEIHMCEEYLTGFGPAMSRLFGISWTEKSFLMIFAFTGPVLYSLTALGLYYRIPISGFVAWFIFIGPGIAEFTHFIFPLLKPALLPESVHSLSQTIHQTYVAGMPNYWYPVTGRYYFAGMYTAVLPMIPGIYAVVKFTRLKRQPHA
jgi:hypothetical protein